MAGILIVYGTTHGHTERIVRLIAHKLRVEGFDVDSVDARAAWNVSPAGYAGVIVAASIRFGGYQRPVVRWTRRHRDALRQRPGAFISVCLGVLESRLTAQLELGRIMRHFLERAGWRPQIQRHVAGALSYTRYGWLTRRMMRRIAARSGGDTDTSRDHDYTDWAEIEALALQFAAGLKEASPRLAGGFTASLP